MVRVRSTSVSQVHHSQGNTPHECRFTDFTNHSADDQQSPVHVRDHSSDPGFAPGAVACLPLHAWPLRPTFASRVTAACEVALFSIAGPHHAGGMHAGRCGTSHSGLLIAILFTRRTARLYTWRLCGLTPSVWRSAPMIWGAASVVDVPVVAGVLARGGLLERSPPQGQGIPWRCWIVPQQSNWCSLFTRRRRPVRCFVSWRSLPAFFGRSYRTAVVDLVLSGESQSIASPT